MWTQHLSCRGRVEVEMGTVPKFRGKMKDIDELFQKLVRKMWREIGEEKLLRKSIERVWGGTLHTGHWVWWHGGPGTWGSYPQWPTKSDPPTEQRHLLLSPFPQTSGKALGALTPPRAYNSLYSQTLWGQPEQKILRISMAPLKYICLCL